MTVSVACDWRHIREQDRRVLPLLRVALLPGEADEEASSSPQTGAGQPGWVPCLRLGHYPGFADEVKEAQFGKGPPPGCRVRAEPRPQPGLLLSQGPAPSPIPATLA